MKKTIPITESKAIRIEPVVMNGKPWISLRQMYKRKNDPAWQHGKGLNIELEHVADVIRAMKKFAGADVSEFTVIEFGDKQVSEPDEKGRGAKRSTKSRRSKSAPWEE